MIHYDKQFGKYKFTRSDPDPVYRQWSDPHLVLNVWIHQHCLNFKQSVVGARVSSKQSNFSSVRTETNRNSICFGWFSVSFAKPKKFFSVCFGVSDRYRNNQNKQNFLETNRKNLQKMFSIRGSSKPLFFFSVRTKTNRNSICFGCFSVCFFVKPKKLFLRFVLVCFDVLDRYRNNRNKQNLWYGKLKRLIF